MNSMETDKNTVNSYIKEIEGYLNKKRVLYEAEGKRDFVPLIDRTVQMLRTIKDTVSETSSAEQSKSSSSQHTFDRLPGKMYHYAEGEVIDCAICIEQVEAKQAQVRLSCGHIYHLNCLGSHFNHSGDFKCPYCRLEVEEYVKQPRAWEYPVNGPPTQQNLNETNDIPHPGELDFANFQRGVLQVVNSIFGGRLNLGHPFRDDNGTEEEFFDNEAEDGSDVDQVVYEPRFDEVPDSLENSENEYDSEHILSDDSEDEPYELVNNYRYVTLVRRDGRNDTSEIEPPQLSVPHSRSRQPSVSRSHSPRSSISRSRSPPPQTTQSNHHHHRHPDNTTSSIRSRSPSPRDNYYHERERYYGYSSNPSHSPIREIYGGGVSSGTSSRRYENRNLPSFIHHSTQMLYERSQNHIERSNSSRNHLFSTIQEEESRRDILRLDNDNSRAESKGSTPFVRTDGSSYNNSNRINYNDTTQPILNETSVAPLMRYETTSDSECEFSNTIFSRHSTTASIMRNMYQEENSSGINDLEDIESSSLSSSSTEHSEVEYDEQDEDEDDERDEHDEEVMYTGSFNWGAENDMDTSDEDTEDDEGYRRCLSRPYSASSDSQGFSSSDEDERNFIPPNTNTSNNRNRNNQSNNRTSNNSTSNETTNQTNQQWFKPWAWYAAHHNTPVYYA